MREVGRRLPAEAERFDAVLVIEQAAIEPLRPILQRQIDRALAGARLVEPLADARSRTRRRIVHPGQPTRDDAVCALAALDAGVELVRSLQAAGTPAALVTAPLSKAPIAQHVQPEFRGHTDYLAQAAGLEHYGRDYLMGFLAPDLRVALLSTHWSLRQAIERVSEASVLEALHCLARHGGPGPETGPIAVCGLNPHAGEGGLLGNEDDELVRPAIERARAEEIDAHGPLPADTVFARARRGDFRWVLALYHDQGLVAVKTAAFGLATNWTLGLPYLRTSVDHGTAYDIAGRGVADTGSLRAVIDTTLELLETMTRLDAGASS